MSAIECFWCGAKGEAKQPVAGWAEMPPGWLAGFVERDIDVLMCSVDCATSYERGEALLRERKALCDEAYGNTTRNDPSPERTARELADARMVEKFGKDWRLATQSPRSRP